jgi:predicted neuraminidase
LFQDGRLGLPVYHEFLGKFGELLRLASSESGLTVLNKRRISDDFHTLQPIIFIDTPLEAIAYFRQARDVGKPQRIPTSMTHQAGYRWDMSNDLTLPNPNSALAGLTLLNGDRLLVWNDLEDKRCRLVMAISEAKYLEGHLSYTDWTIIHTFEDESALPTDQHSKFAYPYLITDQANHIHVVYTWRQEKIKHVEFSSAYIERLKEEHHVSD